MKVRPSEAPDVWGSTLNTRPLPQQALASPPVLLFLSRRCSSSKSSCSARFQPDLIGMPDSQLPKRLVAYTF